MVDDGVPVAVLDGWQRLQRHRPRAAPVPEARLVDGAAYGVVERQVERAGHIAAAAVRTAQFGGDGQLLAPVDRHLVEEGPAGPDVVLPHALSDGGRPGEARAARAVPGLPVTASGDAESQTWGASVVPAWDSGGSDTAVSSSPQVSDDEPDASTRSTTT
ncbi:hypothetical protein N7U49_24850 [Streptomyces sp. AD2-2]|nr:hypothetical protein N7U49_24850 [Streptomyces sp. AD2-2]